MSKICDLSGKKAMGGNYVSFSNRKTKRRFYPNLKTKKFYIPEWDEWMVLKVSTSALKTINRIGIYEALKKYGEKGLLSEKVFK